MMGDLDGLLQSALATVTKPFRQEKKKVKRSQQLSQRAIERLYAPQRSPSLQDACYEVMEEAYLQTSSNNTLPANARQIMYRVRALIQDFTDEELKANYFTQKILPRFIRWFSQLTADWDVVYDGRGHFEEPHTKKRVDLGTVAVRNYVRNWTHELKDELEPITLDLQTLGPANRYKFALFVEKEGFDALLNQAQISRRYDIAIMSSKGMSVTAARSLVEHLSEEGVTTLVAHDFDASGFTICHTLQTDTDRYQFQSRPNVKCLGLRLTDVDKMNLDSENVHCRSKPSRLREKGATEKEIKFLTKGQRVELNAMTSEQFVDWLEKELKQHGVKKLVPEKTVLKSAYKLAVLTARANEALAKINDEWNWDEITVPANLANRISRILKKDSRRSWDEALWMIVSEDE